MSERKDSKARILVSEDSAKRIAKSAMDKDKVNQLPEANERNRLIVLTNELLKVFRK